MQKTKIHNGHYGDAVHLRLSLGLPKTLAHYLKDQSKLCGMSQAEYIRDLLRQDKKAVDTASCMG